MLLGFIIQQNLYILCLALTDTYTFLTAVFYFRLSTIRTEISKRMSYIPEHS